VRSIRLSAVTFGRFKLNSDGLAVTALKEINPRHSPRLRVNKLGILCITLICPRLSKHASQILTTLLQT